LSTSLISSILPSVPADEELLLQQLADGSVNAFTSLYKRYQPRLLRLLQPFRDIEDPEEIIQDIFLKLWQKRESLPAVRSIEFYLYRMARNRLIDIRRSKIARLNRMPLMPVADGEDTINLIEYKEFYTGLQRILDTLSARQRLIYRLSVLHDKSLDEIAAETHLSKSVVIKQLYLANKTVRAALQKYPGLEWPSPTTLLVLAILFSKTL
jgi:RNA polymerase sigma-70 factor (ECF subfamily)